MIGVMDVSLSGSHSRRTTPLNPDAPPANRRIDARRRRGLPAGMFASLSGLHSLADRYDVLLSDVWGVIHNGAESFEVPCAALARWRAEVGPVVLISNSPRPSPIVHEQLDGLGVPRESWTELVTSGDATRTLLTQRLPGPAYRIGPDRDWTLYEGLGLGFTDLANAAFIACTGPRDDDVETPEDYRGELTEAAARGLTMICANPDKVVQRGARLVYCGGALAELYEQLGGAVEMAGKPHAPIYQESLTRAAHHLGRIVDPGRVLCIGDGIATDLAGAQAQGLDALFIAAGIHAAEAVDLEGRFDPHAARELLQRHGAQAAWIAEDLIW
jgi:HAD superfamily hydrolase (TIGR01459 family)